MGNSNSKPAISGINVPQHVVPAPSTVSAHAQAFLSQKMPSDIPPADTADKESWRRYIEQSGEFLTPHLAAEAEGYPFDHSSHSLAGTSLHEIVPHSLNSLTKECAIFYLHGGAYIHGGGMAGVYMAAPLASIAGLRTFCVDYRMPPDHPFPTGLNDAVEAYEQVLERFAPKNIVVAGGSAGGGLAAALVLKLRDEGLPMPGVCVLATPEADLTESGDSFETNIYVDVVANQRLTASINLYADGHDLKDPYLSPLFGDFSKGFPPTILTSGTRDLFLSNTVLMHRALLKAGVEAELHVWEGMPHGGFFGAPEDREVFDQQVAFIKKHVTASVID